MKCYILTGTPGAGKTSLICNLAKQGFRVVHEAATDVIAQLQAKGIAEPWRDESFIDYVCNEQIRRESEVNTCNEGIVFFDRSPFCTLALCHFLGFEISQALAIEIERLKAHNIYQKDVFFIENLGFCEPTSARQITYEDTLKFEKLHEDVYKSTGHNLIKIEPGTIEQRTMRILKNLHI